MLYLTYKRWFYEISCSKTWLWNYLYSSKRYIYVLEHAYNHSLTQNFQNLLIKNGYEPFSDEYPAFENREYILVDTTDLIAYLKENKVAQNIIDYKDVCNKTIDDLRKILLAKKQNYQKIHNHINEIIKYNFETSFSLDKWNSLNIEAIFLKNQIRDYQSLISSKEKTK